MLRLSGCECECDYVSFRLLRDRDCGCGQHGYHFEHVSENVLRVRVSVRGRVLVRQY